MVGFTNAQTGCDTWVKLQNRFAAITVGDLDVTGDQITVEASINIIGSSEDIVSKHRGANDVNYLLRPFRGEITTLNGFFVTDLNASCSNILVNNKTYHVAMVYDGSTLKFYRNGALLSQVPATGDLVTNDWLTAIGEHAPVVTPSVNGVPNPFYNSQNEDQGWYDESFRGFINEVRIWNVARTQDDIKNYMNTPLPDPTTQIGLLGEWNFNDLLNKQGNTAFNGTIEGLATINSTNPNCTFIPDSCNIVLPVRLTDFSAHVVEKTKIKLYWQTEGENGVKSYSIQRAETPDFTHPTELGSVMAVNNGTKKDYSFLDNTLVKNKVYFYRLQINDKSGSVLWSAVKTGKISGETISIDFYPNPTKSGIVNVRFNDITGDATINILNHLGQRLIEKKVTALPGSVFSFDLKTYETGTYFINVITPENKIVKTVLHL